ncbi:N-acetyltransferase [Pedobacter sp. HMWF019]|uniref:GNAT family N-acetyltransferase n=1 Tax=Pedobacter sp. HMWF019 TaxID=2056856 RepID=UPI000D371316|nr:GNAT family N-acetyltransferase [Pedobacter sp. HMWF019]PTS91836.1 N-acetyltransferase [Pedobacter sp. HMWF019]
MLDVDFSLFPQLTTERLLLRSISAQDLELIHIMRCDRAVNAMVGRETPTSLKQTEAFIGKIERMIKGNESMYWVICLKKDHQLLGTVCCWNFDVENEAVEIGYEMLPEFRRRGIMEEALKGVIEYAFEKLNARVITAFPSGVNINSVSLLKKLNFQLEDEAYSNMHKDVEDIVTYTLKKDLK